MVCMNNRSMRRPQKGFTLIELLVVIAIIGMLSSIILASLNTARAKARDARRLSDLHSMQLALELYASSNNGAYPASAGWQGTCSSFQSKGTTGANGYVPNLAPTYIPVLPTDPQPVGTYGCYIYNSNGTDYMLMAYQTVESYTTANNPEKRPTQPAEADFSLYTSGAAGW